MSATYICFSLGLKRAIIHGRVFVCTHRYYISLAIGIEIAHAEIACSESEFFFRIKFAVRLYFIHDTVVIFTHI